MKRLQLKEWLAIIALSLGVAGGWLAGYVKMSERLTRLEVKVDMILQAVDMGGYADHK